MTEEEFVKDDFRVPRREEQDREKGNRLGRLLRG